MHRSLHIYKNAALDFIQSDFEIETLANDCLFTEGPVWNAEGYYLFSDIPANCVYKLGPGGVKEIFIQQSGTANPTDADLKADQCGSNALAYDEEGLIICRHGNHSLARWKENFLSDFITQYNGRPLNSPNDLIVHSDGRIFFSDPPYGLKDGKPNPEKFQPLAGVYQWKEGALTLVCDKYQYPNGVCLSNDETKLFICSNKPWEKFVSVYDANSLQFLHVFTEENGDGIEIDRHDNIYLCNKEGIILFNARGERLALLSLPTIPANACWGGTSGNDLFITARENVFLIRGFRK